MNTKVEAQSIQAVLFRLNSTFTVAKRMLRYQQLVSQRVDNGNWACDATLDRIPAHLNLVVQDPKLQVVPRPVSGCKCSCELGRIEAVKGNYDPRDIRRVTWVNQEKTPNAKSQKT